MGADAGRPLDLSPTERALLEDMWTRRGLARHEGEFVIRMSCDRGEAIAAGGRIVLKVGTRHTEPADDEPLLR